jgi:hypothetical protein
MCWSESPEKTRPAPPAHPKAVSALVPHSATALRKCPLAPQRLCANDPPMHRGNDWPNVPVHRLAEAGTYCHQRGDLSEDAFLLCPESARCASTRAVETGRGVWLATRSTDSHSTGSMCPTISRWETLVSQAKAHIFGVRRQVHPRQQFVCCDFGIPLATEGMDEVRRSHTRIVVQIHWRNALAAVQATTRASAVDPEQTSVTYSA